MNDKNTDIVIIANFCGDFSSCDNNRFTYLADRLSENYNVELITSNFFHITKKYRVRLDFNRKFKITLLKEPVYLKNISLKRFYSHYIWGNNVKKYINKRRKPNIVICAVPSLTASKKIIKYCKKNNIKVIIDIQDLWPEAFRMIFNIPIISSAIFFPIKLTAQFIYKSADIICGVSHTYVEYALKANKVSKKGITVYIGTDLDFFDKSKNTTPLLEKQKNEIWIAYCGTLGNSYDIPCVIDAISLIQNDFAETITFIVMGDGPKKQEYIYYAEKQSISAIFLGRISYSNMCSMICQCDIMVNPIVKGSAASIINKHADYAASGKPVINTQESLEYRRMIDYYNMGVNCSAGDYEEVAKQLTRLIKDRHMRLEMGKNARKCAEKEFDRKYTYKKLITAIEEILRE